MLQPPRPGERTVADAKQRDCFNHRVPASVLLHTQHGGCEKGNVVLPSAHDPCCCCCCCCCGCCCCCCYAAAATAAATLAPTLQQTTQMHNKGAMPHSTICAPVACERLLHVDYSPRLLTRPRCLANARPRPRASGLLQLLHLAFPNFDPGEGFLELVCQCAGTARRGGAA